MRVWEVQEADLGSVEHQLCHELEDGGGDGGVMVPQSQGLLQQVHVGRVAGGRGQGCMTS